MNPLVLCKVQFNLNNNLIRNFRAHRILWKLSSAASIISLGFLGKFLNKLCHLNHCCFSMTTILFLRNSLWDLTHVSMEFVSCFKVQKPLVKNTRRLMSLLPGAQYYWITSMHRMVTQHNKISSTFLAVS